jgi:pilus assembly protein CpaB
MKKLIIIALFMAGITGFAIFKYTASLQTKNDVETIPVIVALKMIPENTLLTPEMVVIKQLPVEAVNTLSVKSFDALKGRITKENIQANEQILTTKLSSPDNNDKRLSYVLKEGYRAITVKTDEIIGVADNIKKGDFVDLAAVILTTNGAASSIISEITLENIEVLGVGRHVENADPKASVEINSVTIAVLATDIPKVTYALSEGKYRLSLRSVVDKAIVNPSPYTK